MSKSTTEILTFNSQADLLYASLHGKLYGYIAVTKIDSNKLTYPVKIEVFYDLKSFRLYTEPVQAPQEQPKKKKRLSKGAIAGIVIGVLALIGLIVGLSVGLSGCATPTKCIQYNDKGFCIVGATSYSRKEM